MRTLIDTTTTRAINGTTHSEGSSEMRPQDHELTAIRQRMEGVLWELLSLTNTTQPQFNRIMTYIMDVICQVEKHSYPRIGLGRKSGTLKMVFQGHDLDIPASGLGVAIMIDILTKNMDSTTIGMPGEPTQWHIDQMVKEYKKKMPDKPKPEVEINLKDLGL